MVLPFVAILMPVLQRLRRLQSDYARPAREFEVLAATDMLTGLPDRRAFMNGTASARDGGQRDVLLLLEADHFKLINDTWGHPTGDACLRAIARHLLGHLRKGDLLERPGSKEFRVFPTGARWPAAAPPFSRARRRSAHLQIMDQQGDPGGLNCTCGTGLLYRQG